MKRVFVIGLLLVLCVTGTMAAPPKSWSHGGWGAGWFVGGLALGTAVGLSARPYYYYPAPVYVYPQPVYTYPTYPAPAYAYPPPGPVSPPATAYAAPEPPPVAAPVKDKDGGTWVTVPAQTINGTWVPQHKAWVPDK